MYERLQDGTRQIYAFQYPGDFCDLHQHVSPETNNEVAVAAITDCSIGIIEHKDLEQLIAQYPSLGLALWRASMLEASISPQKAAQRWPTASAPARRPSPVRAAGPAGSGWPQQRNHSAYPDGPGRCGGTFDRPHQSHIPRASQAEYPVERGTRHQSGRQRTARRVGQFRRQLPQYAAATVTLAGQDRAASTPAERSPAMWRVPSSAARLCSKPAVQMVDRTRQRVSPLVEQLRVRPQCAPAPAVTPRCRNSAASLATVLIA